MKSILAVVGLGVITGAILAINGKFKGLKDKFKPVKVKSQDSVNVK
jgi:hypothetical protein